MGARGRPRQTKATNRLKRLREYRCDLWRFMTHEEVPITNNLAEQAPSMSKVKQKISGCFRTEHKADTFFTMTKQKTNLFDCLISVFKRQPVQPRFSDWAE